MNENRSAQVEILNRQLANTLALSLNYRKYHWETTGPYFYNTHELFEALYNEVDEPIDEIAERIRMLGSLPIHAPEQIREFATVTIAEPGQIPVRDMLQQAHDNTRHIIQEQQGAIRDIEGRGDPSTVDLLTRLVQIHEKHEWFLRELLNEESSMERQAFEPTPAPHG